jgi:hypothetical protein
MPDAQEDCDAARWVEVKVRRQFPSYSAPGIINLPQQISWRSVTTREVKLYLPYYLFTHLSVHLLAFHTFYSLYEALVSLVTAAMA